MARGSLVELFLIGLICGSMFFGGFFIGTQGVREAAVEEGHAEYYLDEDHDKQWRWVGGTDGD